MSLSATGHDEYRTNGQMNIVANKIFLSLLDNFSNDELYSSLEPQPFIELIPPLQPAMDTVLVVDSTGSMSKFIDAFRQPALEFARESIALGGRVAIVEYRDVSSPDYPLVLCDFSSSIEQVELLLGNIVPDLRSGGDPPEGLLLALMTAYNQLSWRDGATKSAIVLTDASYNDPDKTLSAILTLGKIAYRSKQIDPVNTYVITNPNNAIDSRIQNLATTTDGAVYNQDLETATIDSLLGVFHEIASRPVAVLSLNHYYAKPRETVTFDASLSYGVTAPIIRYEWDFDADGSYDFASSSPATSFTFGAEYVLDGLVVVRVTDSNGLVGTMSAVVDIVSFPPSQSEPATPVTTTAPSVSTPDPSSPHLVTTEDDTTSRVSLAPSTGAISNSQSASPDLRSATLAVIILLLWISKQFWLRGAPATSVVTQWSSYWSPIKRSSSSTTSPTPKRP